jgi:4-azaleucine resistance transporter AzlC
MHPTPRQEFLAGVKATIPMIVGAVPFGIIFGATSIIGGMSPLAVVGMSTIVFAGSAQFIGAKLFTEGVGVGIIWVTTFILNLRHALYSASLGPYLRGLPQKWLIPLGFWLTDETYAVVIGHYHQHPDHPHKHWFQLGSSVAMYVNWNIATLVGIVAGQSIPDARSWGLDFALTVTFIGIVVPLVVTRPVLVSVLVAGISALLTANMPNKLGLMLSAVLGILAGVLAESLFPQTHDPIQAKITPESD